MENTVTKPTYVQKFLRERTQSESSNTSDFSGRLGFFFENFTSISRNFHVIFQFSGYDWCGYHHNKTTCRKCEPNYPSNQRTSESDETKIWISQFQRRNNGDQKGNCFRKRAVWQIPCQVSIKNTQTISRNFLLRIVPFLSISIIHHF